MQKEVSFARAPYAVTRYFAVNVTVCIDIESVKQNRRRLLHSPYKTRFQHQPRTFPWSRFTLFDMRFVKTTYKFASV